MSTLDFMMSERLQRVLGAVLLSPDREHTLSELVRLGGSGRGATQVVVDNLLKAGIVNDRRQANLRLFTANTAHPLFSELRAIALKTFGLADRVRGALAELGDGVDLAFIFGSFAKGTDVSSSDIDLMVVGTADLFAVTAALGPAETEIGRPIHANVYAPDEWAKVRTDKVVGRILAGPKIVLVGRDLVGGLEEAPAEPRGVALPQGRGP